MSIQAKTLLGLVSRLDARAMATTSTMNEDGRRTRFSLPAVCAIPLFFGLVTLLPDAAEAKGKHDGFLYGRIETVSGDEYIGRIRWGKEEAFWDDLFNSSKIDLPAAEYFPRGNRRREKQTDISLFGSHLDLRWGGTTATRQFACRFGEIERMEVDGDDGARLTFRSGAEIDVAGYSNDVGNPVKIWDDNVGKISIKWDRIDTIEFLPTPDSIRPEAYRLRGTVETTAGDFTGFIQWDSEECLSTDLLDGDSRDGDLSIEFGRIRSIERRRNHSRVTFKDGRELSLDGSNDVDDSNRGILVEDPRYGRVKVPWKSFDQVVFDDESSTSGAGIGEYRLGAPLRAEVADADGESHTGRLHFDMDESESFEFLNGEVDGVEFNIPFYLVDTIEPKSRRSSRVRLIGGETLRLSNGHDVSDDNDGVLLMASDDDEDPLYLEWRDVMVIRLIH